MTQPNTGSAHRKESDSHPVSCPWESPNLSGRAACDVGKGVPAQAALRIPIPFIGIRGCPFRVLDDGENIFPVSRLSFSPVRLAFGRSDLKPTDRRPTDDTLVILRRKARRSQESKLTGTSKSARRNTVRARPVTDPRTVWQASEGRFPTCDPPRSGSGHTRADRFLPQLLRTINRPLWESDS